MRKMRSGLDIKIASQCRDRPAADQADTFGGSRGGVGKREHGISVAEITDTPSRKVRPTESLGAMGLQCLMWSLKRPPFRRDNNTPSGAAHPDALANFQ